MSAKIPRVTVQCETCRKEFEATQRRRRQGLSRFCSKPCWYKTLLFTASAKACTKCGVEKPYTSEFFFRRKDRPSGLSSSCKVCKTKEADDYWRGREGGRPGKNKRWWAKQGPDAYAEYQRKQRATKPDQFRVYSLTAYRLHRDEKIANGRRYRARKLGIGGDITPADIEVMWTAQSGRCFYCFEMLAKGYHLDHKTPLVRGGLHVPENGCLSCASCNHKKHTLTADEFIQRQFGAAADW